MISLNKIGGQSDTASASFNVSKTADNELYMGSSRWQRTIICLKLANGLIDLVHN